MKSISADNLILPVFIPEDSSEVDKVPSGSYVLGRGGLCIIQRGEMLSSIRPVDCEALVDVEGKVWYHGAKVDADLFNMAYLVFQAIFNRHRTETQALLYCKGTEFFLRVPKQKVSGAAVSYELSDDDLWFKGGVSCSAPEDVAPFGTIHSHSNMGAFFSGTDDHDHTISPGIHLVIGNFQEQKLVDPGKRIKVIPPDLYRVRGRVSGGGQMDNLAVATLVDIQPSVLVMPELPADLVNVNTPVVATPQWTYRNNTWSLPDYARYDRTRTSKPGTNDWREIKDSRIDDCWDAPDDDDIEYSVEDVEGTLDYLDDALDDLMCIVDFDGVDETNKGFARVVMDQWEETGKLMRRLLKMIAPTEKLEDPDCPHADGEISVEEMEEMDRLERERYSRYRDKQVPMAEAEVVDLDQTDDSIYSRMVGMFKSKRKDT